MLSNEINELRNKMLQIDISTDRLLCTPTAVYNSLTQSAKGGILAQLQNTFGNFDLSSSLFRKDLMADPRFGSARRSTGVISFPCLSLLYMKSPFMVSTISSTRPSRRC